jgi:hypothetical protein
LWEARNGKAAEYSGGRGNNALIGDKSRIGVTETFQSKERSPCEVRGAAVLVARGSGDIFQVQGIKHLLEILPTHLAPGRNREQEIIVGFTHGGQPPGILSRVGKGAVREAYRSASVCGRERLSKA